MKNVISKETRVLLSSVMFLSCKMPVIIATRQKRHDVCYKTNIATGKSMPTMMNSIYSQSINLTFLALILLRQYYVCSFITQERVH